jgi:hypothetical protein
MNLQHQPTPHKRRRGTAIRPSGGGAALEALGGPRAPATGPEPSWIGVVSRAPRRRPRPTRPAGRAAAAPAGRLGPNGPPVGAAPGRDPPGWPVRHPVACESPPADPRSRPGGEPVRPPTATRAQWRAPGTSWWPAAVAVSSSRFDRTGYDGNRQGEGGDGPATAQLAVPLVLRPVPFARLPSGCDSLPRSHPPRCGP